MQLVPSMTNTQVVQEIAAGNEDMFNALYEATYKMVYLQAQKILHDQDAAESVTQDVFVTVYRNIGKLENPEALRSWIGGIAIRLALKQRQTSAQAPELDIDSEQMMDLLDKSPQVATPETALCDAESGKIIAELVDQLPQAQRATVLLYYYDSCAIRQIADIMECSEGTVKSRLNYARKAMQQLIEQTEQRDNIRLHSFSPALLLLGLGAKEQALQLSPSIWQSIAGKLGFGAAAGAGSVAGSAAAGSSAVSSTANTAAGAGVKAAIGGGTKAAAGAKVAAVAGKQGAGAAAYIRTDLAGRADRAANDVGRSGCGAHPGGAARALAHGRVLADAGRKQKLAALCAAAGYGCGWDGGAAHHRRA